MIARIGKVGNLGRGLNLDCPGLGVGRFLALLAFQLGVGHFRLAYFSD